WVDLRREPEATKLPADSQRRLTASTRLSPALSNGPRASSLAACFPKPATVFRPAAFRAGGFLLAAFFARRLTFLAAIAAAPVAGFPPHSSVRPRRDQSRVSAVVNLFGIRAVPRAFSIFLDQAGARMSRDHRLSPQRSEYRGRRLADEVPISL